MRNTAKKLVSAVAALTMVASMSITAFAADYASAPVFSSSSSASSSATEEEITNAVENAVETAVSDSEGADDSEDAEETKKVATVEVKSTKNLSVKPSTIKDLAKKENTVLEIVAPKATISIDSSTIKKAKNVDLTVKIVNSKSRTKLDFRSKKDFGCEVKITLTECKMSAEKLTNAHWYLNGEDMGPVELDEDGNPVITLTKGGEIEIK